MTLNINTICHQVEQMVEKFIKANIGIPTAVIGVCARYIHSTDSVFDIRTILQLDLYFQNPFCNLDNNQIETLQYK